MFADFDIENNPFEKPKDSEFTKQGFFHKWVVGAEDKRNYALIELPMGRIIYVPTSHIKFARPPKNQE